MAVDDRRLSRRGRRDARNDAAHRQAARHVICGRARAGAAVSARDAVDAAARRSLRRVRVGPHARPWRAAAARVRSRVRAVRSRRLARPAPDRSWRPAPSRVLATHGHAEALARYLREHGLEAGVIRTAWEGEAARERWPARNELQRFAAGCSSDRSDDVDQRQGRRDGAVLRERAAGGCRVGGVLPHRTAAQATGARDARSASGRWRRRGWRMAARANAMPSSATARRLRRSMLDQLPSWPVGGLPLAAWIEERILPLRELDPLDAAGAVIDWWQRARSLAAVHPAQAADGRAPRRRLADAASYGRWRRQPASGRRRWPPG